MSSLKTFSLSARLLWAKCAMYKGFQMLWDLLGTASFYGQSRVMGILNLTNVLWLLYLGYRYNNLVDVTVTQKFETIAGFHVFNDSYMRVASPIALRLLRYVLDDVSSLVDNIKNLKHYFVTIK
ncbi:hypothetical protein SPRG_13502 [Saprolegnia parasitica CBS 223.65]|uniref:Uncharacterized protein n=1 Tax=Saprolegnia parasitica (strain CBS 223.65) TaxID=695850 RepID=A0A067C0L7_SAPPC|nr:hypothetical protein SPRG_13502 [Saprolegnia parasitica CBS 223.65]KDO20357.1 hypothetical protein SPRG_13502 [Saprolegnia parasitica CBS 223.65]|eukprot:XP_012208952.1 hypothetical protein SPRG_13502 [Saprolegnia parasitica CBS 223.65]